MMNCETCGKRLSRKSARLINASVVCGVCMWKPAIVDGRRMAETGTGSVRSTTSDDAGTAIAQPSSPNSEAS